jgi:hypothetical protein
MTMGSDDILNDIAVEVTMLRAHFLAWAVASKHGAGSKICVVCNGYSGVFDIEKSDSFAITTNRRGGTHLANLFEQLEILNVWKSQYWTPVVRPDIVDSNRMTNIERDIWVAEFTACVHSGLIDSSPPIVFDTKMMGEFADKAVRIYREAKEQRPELSKLLGEHTND